jgi:hypothetical protein
MAQVVQGAKQGLASVTTVLDRLLADLVSLKNPVTATAVVAFVLAKTNALGGVGVSNEVLLGIVVGIGVVSNVIKQLVSN